MDYVSVKLSSVASQLNYWDWEGSLERVKGVCGSCWGWPRLLYPPFSWCCSTRAVRDASGHGPHPISGGQSRGRRRGSVAAYADSRARELRRRDQLPVPASGGEHGGGNFLRVLFGLRPDSAEFHQQAAAFRVSVARRLQVSDLSRRQQSRPQGSSFASKFLTTSRRSRLSAGRCTDSATWPVSNRRRPVRGARGPFITTRPTAATMRPARTSTSNTEPSPFLYTCTFYTNTKRLLTHIEMSTTMSTSWKAN